MMLKLQWDHTAGRLSSGDCDASLHLWFASVFHKEKHITLDMVSVFFEHKRESLFHTKRKPLSKKPWHIWIAGTVRSSHPFWRYSVIPSFVLHRVLSPLSFLLFYYKTVIIAIHHLHWQEDWDGLLFLPWEGAFPWAGVTEDLKCPESLSLYPSWTYTWQLTLSL